MEPFEPKLILVPTDFSEPAAHALQYASALGARFNAHLLVIHADPFIPAVDFSIGLGAFEYSRNEMAEKAREDLQRHAEDNIGENVPFDLRVIVGTPVQSILRQVQESGVNLIVMGTHGRTGLSRFFFGSLTEAVMRFATVPVIAVSRSAVTTGRVSKVVCPVTFTAACHEALRIALGLASNPGLRMVLIPPDDSGDPEQMRAEKWVPADLAARCETSVLTSSEDPYEIAEAARAGGADLLAIGVPAGRMVHESLRGSLAERLVQQSACPVLIVNAYSAGLLPAPPMNELFTAAE